MMAARDHGGGVDRAALKWGGARRDWLDLSTGINPIPYPVPNLPASCWTALPDYVAQNALDTAARNFWNVPDGADVLAAPGASALIAQIPKIIKGTRVQITPPTYNEHAAAFTAAGWSVVPAGAAQAVVHVHPNNPDGRTVQPGDLTERFTVLDESFCDVTPDRSLVAETVSANRLVLKSFGKFWGLAGMRLGFAIGHTDVIASLRDALGPWPVSGPALEIGATALADQNWANQTRTRLAQDATRLDSLMTSAGAKVVGGTDLFRLYNVDDAPAWQDKFARQHIWTRIFPYSTTYLRLGLPPSNGWSRLEAALCP